MCNIILIHDLFLLWKAFQSVCIKEPWIGSPGPPGEIKSPLFGTLNDVKKTDDGDESKYFDDHYDHDEGDEIYWDEHEYKAEDGLKMKMQLNIRMKMWMQNKMKMKMKIKMILSQI